MNIEEIGEFGLIERLTKDFAPQNKTTIKGVGDDCAVMDFGEKQVVATTDMLLEGVHFDLTYVPLKHLGYKSAMVNISDVCAMNAKPTQMLVSLGVSSRFGVEQLEEFYAGLYLACEKAGVDVVGGDTCASLNGLSISITCMGEVEKGKAVLRNGAKPNDLICVTGDLGAAYMGLQLLEREKKVFESQKDPDFQPDFAGKEYIIERQLKPEACIDTVKFLKEKNVVPTAMMDVSDGLSSELMHICKESGVGCRVYENKIPIDYVTASMAEEFNMNLTTVALNGGEDYELLFTVPLSEYDKVKGLEGIHVIGHVTDASEGARLVTRDGAEIELKAQGWKAF
ncbi:MAG: thiamine-phosphate kinase [Paludibacteraceae bacterium]|nr:thiamine-phosphate kinase [Paludibacteraceae bacterium]